MSENENKLIRNNNFDFNTLESKFRNREYKYIAEGSGRRVYDLGNGYVVKVAKNPRGFAQNKVEYDIAKNSNLQIFATVLTVSDDFRYLIMERAERIKNIYYVMNYFKVKNARELYHLKELQDIARDYELILRDLGRASNWGQIKDRPVIVDYGFTKEVRRKYY
ncbi:hypothetical protein EDD66_105281 [Mobilisporobacter senegalensis]|uniref:Protein kinase domain-containing protein n=1 Tax=Mobilisporobacter senegalensis TaxID=1329262 RepID=A0A3N1XNT7_9FIRM|nr:hypothetical protein [Mobilisporobacter senegalensis]ROR28339.1 hypothetical protein EDD66_105281 [Mobilisporobacter senegalensis]